MTKQPGMIMRAAVIGGAGAVGSLFRDLLVEAGIAVTVIDQNAPDGAQTVRCAADHLSPAAIAVVHDADLVLLTLPEQALPTAVPEICRAMRSGSLLADTASVKQPVCALLSRHAHHVEVLSVNPLFAPSLGFDGQKVAVVPVRRGPRGDALTELFAQWGATVHPVTAAGHDRLMAAGQTLTHAAVLVFGHALADLGVDIGELAAMAPPPCQTMLALLARVTAGAPEVYWDIQASNPDAPRARAAARAALDRVDSLAAQGDFAGFAQSLTDLAGTVGESGAVLRQRCHEMFVALFEQQRSP